MCRERLRQAGRRLRPGASVGVGRVLRKGHRRAIFCRRQERAIAEESKKGTAAVHLGAKARQPITSSSSRGRAHAFALPKSAGNAKPNQKKRKSGRHMSVGQLYLDAYVCM